MYIKKLTLCIGKQFTEAVAVFNELIAQRELKICTIPTEACTCF